jgi:type II secretory pathway component PulJ
MPEHFDLRSQPMTRPHASIPRRLRDGLSRPAYTLVEILTATVLMLIIMMAVTVIFASVTDSIGQSRATLEMSQRLRSTIAILKQDLENVTATMSPPRHPRSDEGYFQYIEGPIGPVVDPSDMAWNSELSVADATVGDIDDILMFTATTKGKPYNGLINGVSAVSNSAEIIWFVRGRTLYRRVLLIKPETNVREVNPAGFYALYDLSVRKAWDDDTVPSGDPSGQHRPVLAANSLADLTRPECRFAHQPDLRAWTRQMNGGVITPAGPRPTPYPQGSLLAKTDGNLRYWNEPKPFPFFLRPWLGAPYPVDLSTPFKWVPGLGLPILAECSASNWRAGDALPSENAAGIKINDETWVQMPQLATLVEPNGWYDAWNNEHPWPADNPLTPAVEGVVNSYTGALVEFAGSRNDDVILTNVIGFDVKAWDPNAPILTTAIPNPFPPPATREVTLLPGDPAYIPRFRTDLVTRITSTPPPFSFDTEPATNPMPYTGAFVDLNFLARVPVMTGYYPDNFASHASGAILPVPSFGRQCGPLSLATGTLQGSRSLAYGTQPGAALGNQVYDFFPAVYDTWSLHYEFNRHTVFYYTENPLNDNGSTETVGNENGNLDLSGNPLYDEGTNGLDDDNQNGVDDVGERETQPPYAVPLQGIQVSIRVFEPGSRQVREVTLVQKFRTK